MHRWQRSSTQRPAGGWVQYHGPRQIQSQQQGFGLKRRLVRQLLPYGITVALQMGA